jgi:hypothetical protein
LALEPTSPAAFDFVARAAQAYAKLIASPHARAETALGGTLFYAGEPDGAGRALVVAASIAGAASLAATGDRAAQKQALRDGVVDFLVNSLDESLRILKNQLRKRESVAVCVALAPAVVEREIEQRGVVPDLLRSDVPLPPHHPALLLREGEQAELELEKTPALVTWRVHSAPAQWLPKLDAIALDCLDADAWAARRWLRLAPRFLGRLAQGLRLLDCDRAFAVRFVAQARQSAARGEIPVAFEIQTYFRGQRDDYLFTPGEAHGAG